MNVGENTALGNGDVSQELVQLLVIADGELEMTGDDTGLLVVTGGVTGQLEDFGSEVLKDSREVDGGTLITRQKDADEDTRASSFDLPAPTR